MTRPSGKRVPIATPHIEFVSTQKRQKKRKATVTLERNRKKKKKKKESRLVREECLTNRRKQLQMHT
jgi:hypothetical protein